MTNLPEHPEDVSQVISKTNKLKLCDEMSDQSDKTESVGLLPMKVVFQHQPNKSTSFYSVEFPIKSPIHKLKADMYQRVKVKPEHQKWLYRGSELDDQDTIYDLRIKRDETFFIEENNPSKQASATEKKKLPEATGT